MNTAFLDRNFIQTNIGSWFVVICEEEVPVERLWVIQTDAQHALNANDAGIGAGNDPSVSYVALTLYSVKAVS